VDAGRSTGAGIMETAPFAAQATGIYVRKTLAGSADPALPRTRSSISTRCGAAQNRELLVLQAQPTVHRCLLADIRSSRAHVATGLVCRRDRRGGRRFRQLGLTPLRESCGLLVRVCDADKPRVS
jgi:hypothetical protein